MTASELYSETSDEIITYLVGGAVRDQLLNRSIVERDYVVVGATVKQMLALGFQQVGKDFPVFLHPKTKEEYALARIEKKSGQGYTGFVCHAEPNVSLEQDLLRRDLTVNAMALTNSGEIIDPYNGQRDLENKILRHVSPAFSEDPLRVLRVARFAARYHYLGFSVCPETKQLMQKISQSGELKALSIERVLKEMQRSLSEQSPEVFFDILQQCNALQEIWPELDAVWLEHGKTSLNLAVNLSIKLNIRFIALILSIYRDNDNSHTITQIEKMLVRLKLPNEIKQLATKAVELVGVCHQTFELTPQEVLTLFDKVDLWRKPELLSELLLVAQVDFHSNLKSEEAKQTYIQANYLIKLSEKVRAITAKPFVEQGLKGLAIKTAIHQDRLTIIENFVL